MSLSKKEIDHIANLARLELSDEEKELYGGQLSSVLEYIDKLQEVDTNGIEPTAQVTGLENVLRSDEVEVWDKKEQKDAFDQAPDFEDEQYKVKRVLS